MSSKKVETVYIVTNIDRNCTATIDTVKAVARLKQEAKLSQG